MWLGNLYVCRKSLLVYQLFVYECSFDVIAHNQSLQKNLNVTKNHHKSFVQIINGVL